MTRGRDIFWGLYAAIIPWFSVLVLGRMERYLEKLYYRSFSFFVLYLLFALLFILLGAVLAVLAARFCSRPAETSRVPMVGLVIGWVSSILIIVVFLGFLHSYLGGLLLRYGSRRDFLFAGFYTVVLLWYWKTHTFLSKEELQKEIET